jgi:hypothetical protein
VSALLGLQAKASLNPGTEVAIQEVRQFLNVFSVVVNKELSIFLIHGERPSSPGSQRPKVRDKYIRAPFFQALRYAISPQEPSNREGSGYLRLHVSHQRVWFKRRVDPKETEDVDHRLLLICPIFLVQQDAYFFSGEPFQKSFHLLVIETELKERMHGLELAAPGRVGVNLFVERIVNPLVPEILQIQ